MAPPISLPSLPSVDRSSTKVLVAGHISAVNAVLDVFQTDYSESARKRGLEAFCQIFRKAGFHGPNGLFVKNLFFVHVDEVTAIRGLGLQLNSYNALVENEASRLVLFEETLPRLDVLQPVLCGLRHVLFGEPEDVVTEDSFECQTATQNVLN